MLILKRGKFLDKKLLIENEKKIIYREKINTNKIILSIITKTDLKVKIMNETYNITNNYFNVLFNLTDDEINLEITNLYIKNIDLDSIESIYIQEYSNPEIISDDPYQFVYSFDYNYYQGAFSSINSLVSNINANNIEKTTISMLIPKNEHSLIQNKLLDFINQYQNKSILKCKFVFYLVDDNFLESEIKETKCFKGSNHLLKLSNYSRLIIGHIINTKFLLYLDSDTIVQSDLTLIMDQILKLDPELNFVIMGKRSKLNYHNLFNIRNMSYFKKPGFNFNKNVIYTGTLLINPVKYKNYFGSMMEIVKLHNSILDKGGLYKLFTMSILNIGMSDQIGYFDDYIKNVVDLGYNKNLVREELDSADVLDWSGAYKPWFTNGLFQEYWKKYNFLYKITDTVTLDKNSVEKM